MIETNALNPVQAATSSMGAPAPKALGKEEFMHLLVTQLQNQDPMQPMQDQEFVAQLATFSSLEQLMSVNQNLSGLAAGQSSLINSQALALIGKEALVPAGDSLRIRGGVPDTLLYQLPETAGRATMTIYDKNNAPVRVLELDPHATGRTTLAWDGKDSNGNVLPNGSYRVEITATDAGGKPLTAGLFRSLKIDGVNFSPDGISLLSGDETVPFDSILEIRAGH